MAKCRRCPEKTMLTEEEIEQMVNEVTGMKGIRLVCDAKYEERISVCAECDRFVYGSTCMACGCVMQVRARLQDGRCPKKKWLG